MLSVLTNVSILDRSAAIKPDLPAYCAHCDLDDKAPDFKFIFLNITAPTWVRASCAYRASISDAEITHERSKHTLCKVATGTLSPIVPAFPSGLSIRMSVAS